jgi:ABC-type sugar transport system permease subunit
LLIAIIVATGLGYFVNRGLLRFEFNRVHQQIATLYGQTVDNFYLTSDVKTIQRLVEQLSGENVADLKIAEGAVFVAHSEKGQVGQRIPKALFDQTKELGRTKQAALSWPAPETINVSLPLVKAGSYVGIVDLNYKTPKFVPRNQGWLFGALFILFPGVFWLAGKLTKRRWSLRAGAFILIALAVLLSGLITAQSQEFNYASLNQAKDKALTQIESTLQAEPSLSGVAAFRKTQGGELNDFAAKSKTEDSLFIRTSFIFIFCLALAVWAFVEFGLANLLWDVLFKNHLAYSYVAPATIGMLILVFFPIFFGLVLGFTDYSLLKFKEPIWNLFIGFKNFIDILSDFHIFSYQNFYYTLFITVIWTVTNVTLSVGIGLLLAMILNAPIVAGSRIYRTLLIFPWAVPNYITALIWKGMFQRQFGAINGLLALIGLPAISWFDKPFTAFITNLMTNVWLGFPFMMVISLGALQSIPVELYEAADIDGARPWQKFRQITIPLLKPAMTPAIILSVVWTFNMFNIIYLVSGGAPYGATDILITSAYRWAFEKYQYGYAAAYSTIIFIVLLGYSVLNIRMSKATESAYGGK